jgi:hypothetical protein
LFANPATAAPSPVAVPPLEPVVLQVILLPLACTQPLLQSSVPTGASRDTASVLGKVMLPTDMVLPDKKLQPASTLVGNNVMTSSIK